MKFLTLIFLTIGALSEVCYVHKCDDGDYITQNNVCLEIFTEGTESPTTYYELCDPDYICKEGYSDYQSSCVPESEASYEPETDLKPGHNCTENSECASKNCDYDYPSQVKVCKGKQEKEFCSTHTDCDPDYYCKSIITDTEGVQVLGQCTKLLKLNQVCDQKKYQNYQCPIYSECALNQDKDEYQCIQYFSLKAGQYVESCTKANTQIGAFRLTSLDNVQTNWLCETGTCLESEDEFVCANALTSENGELTGCDENTEQTNCASSDSTQYTECRCGRSTDGGAYCMPNLGDSKGTSFLNATKQWVENYIQLDKKCHRDYFLDKDCLSWGWSSGKVLISWTQQYFLDTYQFLYAAELLKNDECTSRYDSVANKYWIATQPIQCSIYQCSSEEALEQWQDDVCIYSKWTSILETPSYEVKDCIQYEGIQSTCNSPPDNDPTTLNVTCSPQTGPIEWNYHYTGYPCESDSDCALAESECKDGQCTGRKQTAPCQFLEGYECSLGNTCQQGNSNNTIYTSCVSSCQENNACCNTDSDCKAGYGCNKGYTDQYLGICQKWLSLDNGDFVELCPINTRENFLCMSGQCLPDSEGNIEGSGTCIPAYSSQILYTDCEYDLNCTGISTLDDNKYTWSGKANSCQCGYGTTSVGQCAQFLGDKEGQEFLEAFKDLLNQDIDDCPSSLTYPQEDLEGDYHQKMWDCYLKKSEDKWNAYRSKEWAYRHSLKWSYINGKDSCYKGFGPYFDELYIKR